MAAAFGGGSSQSAFGARAGATVLSKATAILSVLFMLGALVLSIMGRGGSGPWSAARRRRRAEVSGDRVGGPAPKARPHRRLPDSRAEQRA